MELNSKNDYEVITKQDKDVSLEEEPLSPILAELFKNYKAPVRSEPVCGRDLWEHRAISRLGPNWVHVRVREIDNIVVNQNISQCDKTSLGI